ncbi:MAG: hypothetical protein AAGA29_14755 [Planctomycetota bacterium]
MTAPPNKPLQRQALIALAFIVAAFLIHALAINNPFLIDDHSAIKQHPDVQEVAGGLRLWTHHYWQGSPSLDDQLYRPVTVFSFWLSQRLTPDSAAGFRALNIFLLAAIALCVVSWLKRYTGPLPALLAGALFLVHPANTEAINHLVGRADLLAVVGVVGFLALQARAQEQGWSYPAIAGAAAFALIALGSKESGLALIPCVIAQGWIGTRDTSSTTPTPSSCRKAGVQATDEANPRLAAEASATAQDADKRSTCQTARGVCPKRALFLALFLPAALYLAARLAVVGLPAGYAPATDDLTGNPLRGVGFVERIDSVAHVAGWYTKQLIWPSTTYNHTPGFYFRPELVQRPYPTRWGPGILMLLGGAVYVWLVTAIARKWKKRSTVLAPIIFFLAHLIIVGHLLTVTGAYAANRLTLATTAAGAMLLGLFIAALMKKTTVMRSAIAIVMLAVVLAFAFLTARANRAWSSELARMHADVQADDEDPIALYWLGQAQLDYDTDAAVSHLKRAHALAPQSNQAAAALADALLATGDDRAAWRLYDKLLTHNAPLLDQQRTNAAMAAFNTGRYEQAQTILRSLPDDLARPIREALEQVQGVEPD